jgi:hypothetical protein
MSGNKPELQAFLVRCAVKQNGVDVNVSEGFVERFLDNLRQTQLFARVTKATEIPSVEPPKNVELTLFVAEVNDTHQSEAAINGCLVALTLGLLAFVLKLRADFTSEMILEVKRSDGASKRYSAKSSGTLMHGLWSNHALGGAALGGAVTTCNINSLMSQMLADAEFYSIREEK